MKSLNLNGLYANKFKKRGLIFATLLILIDIIGKISGMNDKTPNNFIIYFIITTLLIAIFSKEKIEDERIQIIRYFALKHTFSFVILAVAITIPFANILHTNFSYYSIIIPMLCYFPIFELVNYYNPDFIFKEKTAGKGSENLVEMGLAFMLMSSIISLAMHFLK